MVRRYRLPAGFAMIGLLLSQTAGAATLDAIQGDVLVNRGSGYVAVADTVQVNPGDLIIANPGGGAILIYENGCQVPVEVGYVVSVKDDPPCDGGTAAGGGTNWVVIGLGVAAVAGGIALAAGGGGGGGGGDRPASP